MYELNIITNDGWVVTLVTDQEIDLGDAKMSMIIVEPKADHFLRTSAHTLGVIRKEYNLTKG